LKIAWGISWNDTKKGRLLGALFCALLSVGLLGPAQLQSAAEATEEMVSIIVRELPGAGNAPETIVAESGGSVDLDLGIIDGFSATVPRSSVHNLKMHPGVLSVTPNHPLQMMGVYDDAIAAGAERGTLYKLVEATKVDFVWNKGVTGQGVDVAVIDTGTAPVEGLTYPGKVINGPDLSFEAAAPNLYSIDTNGHGTHVAGIIAGKDAGVTNPKFDYKSHFVGIAPDARIVSVKVANAQGATDVSQVLAAMHWVVQHRNDNGLNIKVLNLSFGTDGTQDYQLDPLTYAAEVAWQKGITVVVAAGNHGFGNHSLNNPAYDPYVIAVGANDTMGTYSVGDDTIPDWSARGDGVRNPDVVAPGKSVVSLRTPGSLVDQEYGSTGRVGERLFKGSGTSQAAAVVSGAAALVHSQRPGITPDQVKALLKQTADPLPAADAQAQGSGMIDLMDAYRAATPNAVQTWPLATGTGSLEAARGSLHVTDPDGNVLTGEVDIFGAGWSGAGWSSDMWNGAGWSGGSWNGAGWSGAGWSGAGWSGAGWSGAGWSGAGWSGAGWSGAGWSGAGWSGAGWSGAGWSGAGWSGAGWSGAGWSGAGWSGAGWS
jgi:serine protease AprX